MTELHRRGAASPTPRCGADPTLDGPSLVGQAIDRAAHRRRDPEWLAEAWSRGRVVLIDERGQALMTGDPPRLVLSPPDAAEGGERLFLGVDAAGTPYFAVSAELPTVAGAEPSTLRQVGALLDARDLDLFTVAAGLAHWHARHPFHPATGARTRVDDAGWVRRAVSDDPSGSDEPAAAGEASGRKEGPGCGEALVFPRTDPAVIVLIHDGMPGHTGRAMLGRGATWPPERFSCLAGFVEPGESAESTVAREVGEEVGLTVRDVRYVTSQPWPFPGSLMLAFTALADPSQPLRPDPDELAEARWFTRLELAALWRRRSPVKASVAYHLMAGWLYED